MYLDWTTLILLCLAGATGWFWQDSLAARETANAAAREACERMALQFLDGTVAFARLRFARNRHGRLCLRRTYIFDYTANSIERRQGFVVVNGRQVETVGYAQDEAHRSPQIRTARADDKPAQVLHLEDRRARPPSDQARADRPDTDEARAGKAPEGPP